MAENFLEEQIKRIKEMTRQMARLRNSAAELPGAFERDRIAARHDPLHEIRDFRTHSSMTPESDRANEHGSRHQARHAPRRRR